ncbi:MAG TPA: hypothetical protein VLI46_02250 [Ramlibacter sp.]|nr:hypothetical protein [Ramlibacter sp.]
MLNLRLMWIAWPAFLAACVLELVVFAMVDPLELEWSGHPLAWSRQGVYTAAFFFFWAVSLVACALTTLLGTPPPQVKDCRLTPDERPEGCPER